MQKQQIGIFSGSFNPVHAGHLILANYICEFTELDEVWFVVSPHNPFKEREDLLDDDMRLEMVRLALEKYDHMIASDVELHMPRPSYTIDTLARLTSEYPDKNFTLIIGSDNWKQFPKWKESQHLIKNYQVLVYPRLGEEVVIPEELTGSVRLVEAPIVEISSTFIRESIRNGKNMRAFLPPKVYDFIVRNGIYIC
ncbi:MAG: nicotinate (nicotinamide) nucleotide adenylyltransferase [Proteiniphilum sp.]|uniref:nicotinate (nicotinamide) nucleotide adenylyltransferase n=1 Tax=Proteiniphilum sp. TaxID=1926877 RepID=UPI002B201704|nr:nicotinate (nicotinamide) nucleotide adenylyltransferase [Proteiniphilum sp.]MEA5130083.1 nicotinate (nicotinamide) nucleotide adenylyltransferase [Proteiniphilum sp.]